MADRPSQKPTEPKIPAPTIEIADSRPAPSVQYTQINANLLPSLWPSAADMQQMQALDATFLPWLKEETAKQLDHQRQVEMKSIELQQHAVEATREATRANERNAERGSSLALFNVLSGTLVIFGVLLVVSLLALKGGPVGQFAAVVTALAALVAALLGRKPQKRP